MLDEVLAAFVSRHQSAVSGARYTENGVALPVGEGLWATADKIGPYRHEFHDTASGQAAAFVTVTERETRSIMAMRVRQTAGAVSEIEVVIARPPLFGGVSAFGDGPAALDRNGGPDSGWLGDAGPEIPRADLRRLADMYFAGLERNDGLDDYPFADDCIRIENGFRTTQVPPSPTAGKTPYLDAFRALSAKEQFETGYFAFVDRIRDRRFR